MMRNQAMRSRWRGPGGHPVAWVVALAAALAAGCGAPAGTPAQQGADAVGAELSPERLPSVLPTDPNGVVVPPVPLPSDAPGGAGAVPEPVAGYTGNQWAPTATGKVTVVAGSTTLRGGVLRGLVRNGRNVAVGPVEVSVGDRSSVVGLPVLRPGEPAPFEIAVGRTVEVDEALATIEVRAPAGPPPAVRGLRLGTYWQRASDEGSVDTYLVPSSQLDGPTTVAFGSATAAQDVADLRVVAAWVDETGAVVAVDESGVVQSPSLAAGASTDFVVRAAGILDGGVTLVLWGTGR